MARNAISKMKTAECFRCGFATPLRSNPRAGSHRRRDTGECKNIRQEQRGGAWLRRIPLDAYSLTHLGEDSLRNYTSRSEKMKAERLAIRSPEVKQVETNCRENNVGCPGRNPCRDTVPLT